MPPLAHGGALQPPLVLDGGEHSPGEAWWPFPPLTTPLFFSLLIKTPTLILYGDGDTSLGPQALQSLQHLPRHHVAVVPDAGHACYRDKPEDFHRALLGFLSQLE